MRPILIIQNCPAERAGMIIDYLDRKNFSHSTFLSYKNDPFPPLKDYDGVICMGCPISISEYQNHSFLKNLHTFVTQVVHDNVPYLGICYGGQLLAKVLGANVTRNPVMEIGIYNVNLTSHGSKDLLFSGFDTSFLVHEWHGDTFGIPSGSQLLVEGHDCKNQAFRHGKQAALQFHFETSKSMLTEWCNEFSSDLNLIGKSKDTILDEFSQYEEKLHKMNLKLMDNFFEISKGK